MNKAIEKQVKEREERLRNAMMGSDIEALDELLSDDLIFTNHQGGVMTKADDLEAHRSGFVKIDNIELSDQRIKVIGDSVAVVTVQAAITGIFGGQKADSVLRFTRVWQKVSQDTWRIITGHSSIVI